MVTVRQILNVKGNKVWSVSPEASVYEALRQMAEREIGALLVMEGEDLVGIFSERDYARKIALLGKSSSDTPVHEVMTREVICVTQNDTSLACMEKITEGRFRHLPVKEGDKVIGVVTIGDLVKAIISEQEFTIKQLENYITGER